MQEKVKGINTAVEISRIDW